MPYKNPADKRAHSKRYAASNKEKISIYQANWEKENKKRLTAKRTLWDKQHPERARARKEKWRQGHPLARVISEARRRTRKNKAGGSFTCEEWLFLTAKYDFKCLCCRKVKPLTADHIIPISKGGTSNIDNIQPLCQACNSSKGTSIIDYRTQEAQ